MLSCARTRSCCLRAARLARWRVVFLLAGVDADACVCVRVGEVKGGALGFSEGGGGEAMPRFNWYAVQVVSGQERKMVRLIEAACAEAEGHAEGPSGACGFGGAEGGDTTCAADDAEAIGDIYGADGAGGLCGFACGEEVGDVCGGGSADAATEPADPREPFALDECFVPRYRTQKKLRGEWRDVERLLMPGYVIAVASDPARLAQRLQRVNGFCRVVKAGQTYVPLNAYERMWLEANTSRGERVVPMSFGRKVGDVLEVTQGPLKGYEGRITKVRRSDSLAFLEFHVGPVRIKTTVGLGVLPG